MAASDIRASTYESGVAVTPTDGAVIAAFAALYVGGAGTVTLTDLRGVKTSYSCTQGSILPVQGKIVWSTGTSATNIVRLSARPVGQ
jgi:hypothetical protein